MRGSYREVGHPFTLMRSNDTLLIVAIFAPGIRATGHVTESRVLGLEIIGWKKVSKYVSYKYIIQKKN